MRDLKFRQAIKEQSAVGVTLPFHWHHWGYLGHGFDGLTLPLGKMEGDERQSYQYTGIKDKDGVEIYEGDIISFLYNRKTTILPVDWGVDGWWAKGRGWYKGLYDVKNTCKVIGNIYENPELLKEVK